MKRRLINPKGSRENILNQAILLFAVHGFHGTSFQAIADKCNLTQTAVLYHFPDRDKLLEGVLEKILLKNHRMVSSHQNIYDNAHTNLLQHFKYNLVWALENPQEAQIILLIYYYAAHNAHFRSVYSRILNIGRERVLNYVLAGIREKIFTVKSEPELIAELLHEALMGGIINALTMSDKKSIKRNTLQKWTVLINKLLNLKKS